VIGLIILGKDPFTFVRTDTPGIWLWAQENKVSEGHFWGAYQFLLKNVILYLGI